MFPKRTIIASTLVAMTMFGTVVPSVFASSSTPVPNSNSVQPSTNRLDSLYGKTIVVDAGHGGMDSGARGVGGVAEKDITLAVALKLTRYLHEAGVRVVLTRATDTDLSTQADRLQRRRHLGDLKGRLKVVRQQPVNAFVSIHCNAAPSGDWQGAQVLYLHENDHGKDLATLMQQSFQENLLPTKRDIQSNRTLYLLKRVQGPTVLAEIGFITAPQEADWLQKPAYQEKVALSIYLALARYFEQPSQS